MKNYNVIMPFAGAMSIVVQAENEEDAIEKAFDDNVYIVSDGSDTAELIEWEFYERTTTGNVNHLSYTEAEAEEM